MSIWDTWAADPRYAQLKSDPRYLQATPQFQKSVHDLFFNYGIQPTAQQNSDYGINPVEANPYGIVQMLQKGLANTNHNSINAANNAGLAESGAAAGALNANNENYKGQYAGAVRNLEGGLAGLLTGYTGTVGSIFDTLEQQPAQQPVAPNSLPPLGSPGLATGQGTGRPTPQQPYQRTGPEAGWNTGIAARLLKPPKPISVGSALHGAGAF